MMFGVRLNHQDSSMWNTRPMRNLHDIVDSGLVASLIENVVKMFERDSVETPDLVTSWE